MIALISLIYYYIYIHFNLHAQSQRSPTFRQNDPSRELPDAQVSIFASPALAPLFKAIRPPIQQCLKAAFFNMSRRGKAMWRSSSAHSFQPHSCLSSLPLALRKALKAHLGSQPLMHLHSGPSGVLSQVCPKPQALSTLSNKGIKPRNGRNALYFHKI